MTPRDARYTHWQQQPDDELDYEPEPGFYAREEAPPDPQTVLERLERQLHAAHCLREAQEDPCLEP